MKGDFTGFSFDGIHCSELGIVRVSGGDRYEEELFPEINDRTNEIIGNDGSNYYGSEYKDKNFSISIAFDSITETQFRRIRRLFGTKKICDLIFDERPYKVYSVKLANPIKLDYICFDEEKIEWEEHTEEDGYVPGSINHKIHTGEKQRIYKGEGEIEFITYSPFAKQLYKTLDLYTDKERVITTYNNVDEWAESSGILSEELFNQYNIDRLVSSSESQYYNLKIPVYNPGDLNTGFYLYMSFIEYKETPDSESKYLIKPNSGDYIRIYGDVNGLLLKTIERKPVNKKGEIDTGVIVNSVNHLIEGVIYDPLTERNDHRHKSWHTTGNLYNEYILEGDFPQILRSDWYFDNNQFKQAIYLNCEASVEQENSIQINYDYLYF